MTAQWVVTGTSMVVEAEDSDAAVVRAQETSGWQWEAEKWTQTSVEDCPCRVVLDLFQEPTTAHDLHGDKGCECYCHEPDEAGVTVYVVRSWARVTNDGKPVVVAVKTSRESAESTAIAVAVATARSTEIEDLVIQ